VKSASFVATKLLVGLATAGRAGAATAFVGASEKFPDHGAVHYVADPGEINRVRIDFDEITDTGATISAGPGCTSLAPTKVRCQVADEFFSVEVELGDGDDFVSVSEENQAVLRGGSGDDRIDGGSNHFGALEYLFGGAGNDVLLGRRGNDVLDGGLGGDILSGGTSCDAETAGQCFINDDTVTYAHRVNRVRADADGAAVDDGERGEGDTIIADVEHLAGGKGNDFLGGTTTNVGFLGSGLSGMQLDGRAGNDVLRGGRAPDRLDRGPGDDVLLGARGRDYLLSGGRGDDRIDGGPGRDKLHGNRGRDRLLAKDGHPDHVNGGPGRDGAEIDIALDHLTRVEKLL
jgi:Ca2+-binding RTX toxin-like protein